MDKAPGPRQAQEVFERVHLELRPAVRPPGVEVEFCHFANASSSIRLRQGRLYVRISDLLEQAPPGILEALAFILLSKLYRRTPPKAYRERYRRYLNRAESWQEIETMRRSRGHKLIAPATGGHFDLVQIFEDLNFRFFFGLMARPDLGWGLRISRHTLGHYDPAHHIIVIGRILDSPRVPRLAIEFVMFHEMLHLRYPVEQRHGRRCVHTPEFKAHEKLFPEFKEAKALLRKLP